MKNNKNSFIKTIIFEDKILVKFVQKIFKLGDINFLIFNFLTTDRLKQNIFLFYLRGHFCLQGSLVPTPCSPGSYQNLTTQVDCKICQMGHYCPESQMEQMYECSLGYYCPEDALVNRKACKIGEYQNLTKQIICMPCPGGFSCDGLATVNPKLCPKGFACYCQEIIP